MRAVVQDRYGSIDALELRDIDRPAVADDEVLVRVHAASVHPDVWHLVSGRPHVLRLMGAGLRRPRCQVPGTDLAGRVQSVGRAVTRFRPGDEVFGESVNGYQRRNGGAFAEYAAVRALALAPKPANLSFEQAAAVPTSAMIALAACAMKGMSKPANRYSSTAPAAASARSRSYSRRPTAPKSPESTRPSSMKERFTPVVDRSFTLDEVRDAIRYLQTGSATGKVVLTV